MKKKLKPTLNNGTIIGYGMSTQFVNTFYLMLVAYFLMYFLTNVLGVSTLLAATIYTITQWAKVVMMIFAGVIVDAVSLKSGKYRPWMLIGSSVLLISLPLMYTNFGLNQNAASAVFVVFYIIHIIAYSLLWTAQRSIVGPMSKNSADVISLTTAAQFGTSLGSVLYGLAGTAILGFFAKNGQEYALTAIVYCLLILGGNIYMYLTTKDYDVSETDSKNSKFKKTERVGFIEMFKSLKGPMIPYFIAMVFGSAQSGFFFALLAYYTKYVLNNPAALGMSLTLGGIFSVAGTFAVRPLCNKIGQKKTYIISTFLSAILYVLIAYLGNTTVPFLILRTAVSFMGVFSGALLPAFANDIADYNEMNGEKPARGFIQSIAGTTVKFGSMISTAVASFGLAAIGFSAKTVPTAEVLSGMTRLMAIGPAVVCLIACVIFLFYKVDENELDKFREDKAKKAEAAAENA
ncbi:MAG: MFS transporter [Sedimentibacter sp.]|uniref:MFS transporter n=1 Tax=Sedimentibacter sp. TaxID=1960295 RepID=UPI003158E72A